MPPPPKRTAYDAFHQVDELVAKPVYGSDGAAAWQEFAQQQKPKTTSSAPLAPIKVADRKAGIQSWQQERDMENEARQQQGLLSVEKSGYVHFKKKHEEEKPVAVTDLRTRPDDAPYFLPSETFVGSKFDYVFTTREGKTGYYWDGWDSVKRQQPGAKPEPSEKPTEKPTTEPESEPTKKKKKKKKQKLQGPVIVNDPNNPLEQVAAALQRQQQQLPLGWQSAQASGKTYYYNATTGERSWEFPKPKLPSGWSAANDPSTGKEYYYNATTKETRWERPT